MPRTLRVGMAVLGVLVGLLTFETASATAAVSKSCAKAPARVATLEARLANLQQHIEIRNAKIADAGRDDAHKVEGLKAQLTHARQRHDRVGARLVALTKRCHI